MDGSRDWRLSRRGKGIMNRKETSIRTRMGGRGKTTTGGPPR